VVCLETGTSPVLDLFWVFLVAIRF
jgi:hypothetical protein